MTKLPLLMSPKKDKSVSIHDRNIQTFANWAVT